MKSINLIKNFFVYWGFTIILLSFFPAQCFAADDDKDIFSLVYENDIFFGKDQDYSNGVRLAWLSSEANAGEFVKWTVDNLLPFQLHGKKHLSLALGQSIYTPKDLDNPKPILNDRPYAGWLYGSAGVVSDTGETLDNLMLTLGVVGPYSYAERVQKFIHSDITDSPIPQGWKNQIKTEPGFILTYEKKWRTLYKTSRSGLDFDAVPQAGFNLGNVETDAMAGGVLRLGYHLPEDYGPPRIRPSLPGSDFFIPTESLNGYFFIGFEGRAVARNIFLDGNSFANSQSVTKKPFVGAGQLGFAFTYRQARLSITHVVLSKEFKQQKDFEQFGAVTLSYSF